MSIKKLAILMVIGFMLLILTYRIYAGNCAPTMNGKPLYFVSWQAASQSRTGKITLWCRYIKDDQETDKQINAIPVGSFWQQNGNIDWRCKIDGYHGASAQDISDKCAFLSISIVN